MLHRALIAEDDSALQSLFTKAFKYAGFDVTIAGDGMSAVNQAMLQTPDVMILDLGLPGISGQDVIKKIRAFTQNMKIIVVTGNHLAESSAEVQLADLFLLKPVDITELVTLAERMRAVPAA